MNPSVPQRQHSGMLQAMPLITQRRLWSIRQLLQSTKRELRENGREHGRNVVRELQRGVRVEPGELDAVEDPGGELHIVDFKVRNRMRELLSSMVEAGNRKERERLRDELDRLMF